MDPATLALTAAGLVAKKALEAASGEADTTAWQGLGRIAQTIRGWFAGDHEATETLDRLEARPTARPAPPSSPRCCSPGWRLPRGWSPS
jgi:hypothetical protein